MNTALAILTHALRMLIHAPSTTIRVLMPALVLVIGCSLAIALLAPDMIIPKQTINAPAEPPTLQAALFFLTFGAVGLIGYALMAILWHRHVLLNGSDRIEDLRPDRAIFVGYIWRAILVGLAQMVAAIPIAILIGILGGSMMYANPTGPMATLLGLVASVIFVWVAMRLSVVLPAAALGEPMRLGESWTTTKPISAALWGVALLLSGLNICVYMISDTLLPVTGGLAILAHTIIYVVEGLVFISVLTTLYGHLVEGRSLGQ